MCACTHKNILFCVFVRARLLGLSQGVYFRLADVPLCPLTRHVPVAMRPSGVDVSADRPHAHTSRLGMPPPSAQLRKEKRNSGSQQSEEEREGIGQGEQKRPFLSLCSPFLTAEIACWRKNKI